MKSRKFVLWLIISLILWSGKIALAQTNFWQRTSWPYKYWIRTLATNAQRHIWVGTISGGLFRSTDHGEHWISVHRGLPYNSIQSLAIDAPGKIFAGVGPTIFRSADNGENWVPANSGLPNAGFLSLAIDSSGYIFAGSYDRGVFRSMDKGEHWRQDGFLEPYINSLAISPNGNIFAATNCCQLAGNRTGSIFRSVDRGLSWTKVFEENYWPFDNRVSKLAINQRGYIFAATNAGGVTRSTDNGKNWLRFDLSPNISFSQLDINSDGYIFAGTYRSGVFLSTDDGENWTRIHTGLPTAEVTCFAIDAEGYVIVGLDSTGIFRSTMPTTAVKESPVEQPRFFSLEQNYPNPFNPSTTIEFSLPRSEYATLKIYNNMGAEVATLLTKPLAAGKHRVAWNAEKMTAGVYLYRLQAGDFVQTRKLVLLK